MNYTVLTRYRLTNDYLHTNAILKPGFSNVVLPNVGAYLVESCCRNTFKVLKRLNINPNNSTVLVIAECRPQIFKKILFSVGCFGAKVLFVYKSFRSKEDYSLSSVYKDYLTYVYQGMEQSGNFKQPDICFGSFSDLENFLRDQLFIVFNPPQGQSNALNQGTLSEILDELSRIDTFVLGPEAGFHPREIDAFARLCCKFYALGPLLFRVHQIVDGLLFLKNLQLNFKKT